MTKYLDKEFSVHVGGSEEYRNNWERIFGKKPKPKTPQAPESVESAPPGKVDP